MKKFNTHILLLLTIIFIVSFEAKSQQYSYGSSSLEDVSIYNGAEILKNITKTGYGWPAGGYDMKQNPSSLVSVLGNPLSITREYSELDDVNLTVYKYDGATFYFSNNIIVSFTIYKRDNFYFTTCRVCNTFLRVGDTVSQLKASFPKSYAASKDGKLFVELYNIIAGGDIVMNDSMIVFSYANGIITEISMQ